MPPWRPWTAPHREDRTESSSLHRYRKENNQCFENDPCVCPRGRGVPLRDRTKCNGQNHCVSCYKGFMLKNNLCEPFGKCACPHGRGLVDSKCSVQIVHCVRCDPGYVVVAKGIKKNQCVKRKPCKCHHGAPYKDRTVCDGEWRCGKCNRGYKLVNQFKQWMYAAGQLSGTGGCVLKI